MNYPFKMDMSGLKPGIRACSDNNKHSYGIRLSQKQADMVWI